MNHFNYNEYFWSEYTEEELTSIIKSKVLDSFKKDAKQELERRLQEQVEFVEL